MLGGRGAVNGASGGATKGVDTSPTHRVPGSSNAARVGAAAGGGTWLDAAKRAGSGSAATPAQTCGGVASSASGKDGGGKGSAVLDEDGFQAVVGRGARRHNKAVTEDAARAGDATTTTTTGSERSHQDVADSADTRGAQEEAEAEDPPSAAELQQAWLAEVAFVKRLRQQGVQGGHPALRAACEARDAAERAWREAKEPAPTSVRLGRAQAKLDRAIALQAEARRAVHEAEREHRERMATLQSALDECTGRVTTRRQQLREVQAEVAAGDSGGPRATQVQQEAIRRVHDTLCGEVGPTIAALVEQLDSATPAWSALNGLLGKLSSSKDILEGAYGGGGGAQAYDIGGDCERWDCGSEWSESHELGDRPGGGDGRVLANGDGDHWEDDQGDDQSMGTGDWWDAPQRRWKAGARWQACGHGQWARSSWADQLEDERQGTGDDGGPPPPARRRLAPCETGHDTCGEQHQPSLHSPAQPQHQQTGQGVAATSPEADPEVQKRLQCERVEHIISMAINAGVNPVTPSGDDLRLLDPHSLDAWVAEHFPEALLC